MEILTTPLGTKFVQPEIPLVKVTAQEALNKAIAPIPQCQNSPSNSPSNPPKKRRQWGDGSGNIQMRPYTSKKGKVYEQYYYCYEIRENGTRYCKGSRYIPIAKLDLIREMENLKKPVTLILQELGLIV